MRVVVFEGTAEEAEQIGLRQQLMTSPEDRRPEPIPGASKDVDDAVLGASLRLIRARGRTRRVQDVVERWVSEVVDWGGVAAAAGRSSQRADGFGERVN